MDTREINISEIKNIQSYTGENCVNCGRNRVELFTLQNGHQYNICEKCHYIKEQKRYCENDGYDFCDLDEQYNWIYYLKEDQ